MNRNKRQSMSHVDFELVKYFINASLKTYSFLIGLLKFHLIKTTFRNLHEKY